MTVHWTIGERTDLALECVDRLAKHFGINPKFFVSQEIKDIPWFFSEMFQSVQNITFMPHAPERRREIKGHQQVKWLLPLIIDLGRANSSAYTSFGDRKPVVEALADERNEKKPLDLETFAEHVATLTAQKVVDMLVEKYDLQEKKVVVIQQPVRPPMTGSPSNCTEKKPSVIIVGLMHAQFQDVLGAWSSKFDLRMIEQGKKITEYPHTDYAIVIPEKIAASKARMLSSQFGDNYIRVYGASSSVKKALNDLNARLGR